MLGKTGTYGVRIVCASSEPLGQLSGEGRLIRPYLPAVIVHRRHSAVAVAPQRSCRVD